MTSCVNLNLTPPPLAPLPPSIHLGAIHELEKIDPTGDAAVKAVADKYGNVHVLVASFEMGNVSEFIVSPDGKIESNSIIEKNKNWFESFFRLSASIDAAFDSVGNLHVLSGEYLIKSNGKWSESSDRPRFSNDGFDGFCYGFVPGAQVLTWICRVRGKSISDKRHWSALGIPGTPFGVVWREDDNHLALLSGATEGQSLMAVVRSETGQSGTYPEIRFIDGDLDGNVHIVYDESPCGGGHSSKCGSGRRYVNANMQRLIMDSEYSVEEPKTLKVINGIKVQFLESELFESELVSKEMALSGPIFTGLSAEGAVDAKFGNGDCCSSVSFSSYFPKRRIRVEGMKGGDFAAIKYEKFVDGLWLKSVDIDIVNQLGNFTLLTKGISIATVSQDRALLVWRKKDAVVCSWVEEVH